MGIGRQEESKWDRGEFGQDEDHAKLADDVDNAAIDSALDLVPVSIRLQRSLIDDYKMIAKQHGIGYQPLMRQILTRFAVAETRQIANDLIDERVKQAKASKEKRLARKRA